MRKIECKFNRKIDLVTCSAPTFDSPMIRGFIHKYHQLFNNIYYIINVGSKNTIEGNVYYKFIKTDLDCIANVILCDTEENFGPENDWRNISLHEALNDSTAEYFFQLEPDFYSNKWNMILDMLFKSEYSLFSYYEGYSNCPISTRIWPAFWCVKRDVLNKIDSNASARMIEDKTIFHSYKKELYYDTNRNVFYTQLSNFEFVGFDHFDYINTQLIDIVSPKEVLMLNNYFVFNKDFIHLRGITEMFNMGINKQLCKSKDEFKNRRAYCKKFYNMCKKSKVNIIKEWEDVMSFLINNDTIQPKI